MRIKLSRSDAIGLRKLLQAEQLPAALVDMRVDLHRAWLMVNRAARTQGWTTMCLPRSLVLAEMLRNRGHNAALKIGINKSGNTNSKGFSAHAWVEVNGEVIGEKATVENRFLELI